LRLVGDSTLPEAIAVAETGAVSGQAVLHGGSGATVWTASYKYTGQLANDKLSMSGSYTYRRTGTSGVSESDGVWSAVKTGGPSQPPGTGGASSVDATGGAGGGGEVITGGASGTGGVPATGGALATGGATAATLDQAARVAGDAQAARDSTCGHGDINFYGGTAAMSNRFTIRFAWESSLPDTGMTIQGLLDCANAFAQFPCADFLTWTMVPAACSFKGARANGAACLAGSQCVTGYCNTPDFTCGVCADMPIVGAPCKTNQQCAPGQACAGADHCYVPQRSLGPCTDTETCEFGHTCINGVCQANATSVGAPCNPAVGNPYCTTDLMCNGSTNTCAGRGYAVAGQKCGWIGGSYYTCVYSSSCPSNQICPAAPVAGSVCNEANNQYCAWPDKCMGGVCVAPPAFASVCPQ
jgi:hypothetical protein